MLASAFTGRRRIVVDVIVVIVVIIFFVEYRRFVFFLSRGVVLGFMDFGEAARGGGGEGCEHDGFVVWALWRRGCGGVGC